MHCDLGYRECGLRRSYMLVLLTPPCFLLSLLSLSPSFMPGASFRHDGGERVICWYGRDADGSWMDWMDRMDRMDKASTWT